MIGLYPGVGALIVGFPAPQFKRGGHIMLKLVIAGNNEQFNYWLNHYLRQNEIKDDPHNYIYVHDTSMLMGRDPKKTEILLWGEWWRNPTIRSDAYSYLIARIKEDLTEHHH